MTEVIPIICTVCGGSNHGYLKQDQSNPKKHWVRCKSCSQAFMVGEQELMGADQAFAAFCDARDDELSRQQNERINK